MLKHTQRNRNGRKRSFMKIKVGVLRSLSSLCYIPSGITNMGRTVIQTRFKAFCCQCPTCQLHRRAWRPSRNAEIPARNPQCPTTKRQTFQKGITNFSPLLGQDHIGVCSPQLILSGTFVPSRNCAVFYSIILPDYLYDKVSTIFIITTKDSVILTCRLE